MPCTTKALAAMLAFAAPGLLAAAEPLFPFVISYDAPGGATDVSAWLDRPAGKHGFLRNQDGRLATDAGPIRLWGTNFAFEAGFPTHDEAERVAARLTRLGINCVRLHHMDSRPICSDFSRAVHLPDSWVPPHFSPVIPPRHPHDSLSK
jgi:hypothetical protein